MPPSDIPSHSSHIIYQFVLRYTVEFVGRGARSLNSTFEVAISDDYDDNLLHKDRFAPTHLQTIQLTDFLELTPQQAAAKTGGVEPEQVVSVEDKNKQDAAKLVSQQAEKAGAAPDAVPAPGVGDAAPADALAAGVAAGADAGGSDKTSKKEAADVAKVAAESIETARTPTQIFWNHISNVLGSSVLQTLIIAFCAWTGLSVLYVLWKSALRRRPESTRVQYVGVITDNEEPSDPAQLVVEEGNTDPGAERESKKVLIRNTQIGYRYFWPGFILYYGWWLFAFALALTTGSMVLISMFGPTQSDHPGWWELLAPLQAFLLNCSKNDGGEPNPKYIKIGDMDSIFFACNAWNMRLPDATNARIQIGLYFVLTWLSFMGVIGMMYFVDLYTNLTLLECADLENADVVCFSEDLTNEQMDRCVETTLSERASSDGGFHFQRDSMAELADRDPRVDRLSDGASEDGAVPSADGTINKEAAVAAVGVKLTQPLSWVKVKEQMVTQHDQGAGTLEDHGGSGETGDLEGVR